MIKLPVILVLAVLLVNESSLSQLKTTRPPTRVDVQNLNQSKQSYEVVLTLEGLVKYRIFKYRNLQIKGPELPFQIERKDGIFGMFGGDQVSVKVENGWLIGFDKGEWGGGLFWFNELGTVHEKILSGNIKDLLRVGSEIYAIEGLAHLSSSNGQILKISTIDDQWTVNKMLDLPSAPYASTVIDEHELLIVTSRELIKVDTHFEIQTLVNDGFWQGYLYPNSIVVNDEIGYVGMLGGILKIRLDEPENLEWLTKK